MFFLSNIIFFYSSSSQNTRKTGKAAFFESGTGKTGKYFYLSYAGKTGKTGKNSSSSMIFISSVEVLAIVIHQKLKFPQPWWVFLRKGKV